MGVLKRVIASWKKWRAKRQREREWTLKDMVHRLRVVMIEDAQWFAHDKTATAWIDRYLTLSNPETWEKERVDHASKFRSYLGCDPNNQPEDPMRHIASNSDLIIGKWYWCRNKRTGCIALEQCRVEGGLKYMGDNCIWALDDNNQALKRWDIVGVAAPPDFDKYVPKVVKP